MPRFRCSVCDTEFDVPQPALDKYEGWTPKYCRACSPKKKSQRRQPSRSPRGAPSRPGGLTVAEVLAHYPSDPQTGVFTDGSCQPNPGPGGWGLVWVVGGEVKAQLHGHDPDTTNNRMELTALIEALELLPADAQIDVHSDSDLCVKTVNQWAAGWKKNGWKRKRGPIKNLDLVKRLYALAQARPGVRLNWIRAHQGHLWNEYADALAMAWVRDSV